MHFAWTADQLALRDAVRALLEAECPIEVTRAAWDGDLAPARRNFTTDILTRIAEFSRKIALRIGARQRCRARLIRADCAHTRLPIRSHLFLEKSSGVLGPR